MRDTSTTKNTEINHWLMLDLLGRKIRLRTEQLLKERGNAGGRELEDWLNATSEVLRNLNAG